MHALTRLAPLLLVTTAIACGGGGGDRPRPAPDDRGLALFNAGSLARPLRAAADSFAAREGGLSVAQENAGSLETARKLTELGRIPDVVALADYEVFPHLLMPAHATWYARFARNRMVLAYTDRSRHASEVTSENWWRVLQRPDVETGRSDPNLDPAGYRALLVWQLAERHYAQPGLAARLLERSPARNVRQKSADLVALLQAGELDYAWEYESVAKATNLRFVRLPHEIDLSTPADSAIYATASVRVHGRTPADTVLLRGEAIVYAFAVPLGAPHPERAARFAAYLASDAGRGVLRAMGLDVLDPVEVVGTGAPQGVGGGRGR